ncbi:hypothetical protein [Georgenia sp. Z1491]|uniref:hypothetical protein n=1 Tax=Georgenia sp. Z1491 TaxID=3416707 RepID=UPI003CEC888A
MTGTLTTRPGLVRALAAMHSGELGLLRAAALDVVAVGEGDALSVLGPDAIGVLRAATGPTSVDFQAHSAADGGATTFLGRASHGIAVSAHLSLVDGDGGEHLYAAIRLVGTHGSVVVDLLRPLLDVRTAAGTTRVPFGVPGAQVPPEDTTDALSAIADSARSGRTVTTNW